MVHPFSPIKSLLQPKPSLPVQSPLGARMPGPMGLQSQIQEEIGFREVRRAVRDNFKNLFAGAQFGAADEASQKLSDIGSTAGEVADGIMGDIASVKGYESFKSGFNMVAQPLDVVLELGKKLMETTSTTETVQAVGLQTLTGLYAAVTPFIGCVTGAVGAAKTLYHACDDVRTAARAIEAIPIVNTGAPRQALEAVNSLLDRRANDGFTKGTIQAVESIVNTALIASGVASIASSAVSLASKLGVLSVVIRRRGIEYKEMKAGRTALSLPDRLAPTVFGECPLLGCYLLCGSDTVAIVVSAIAQGKPAAGWMDQVTANKKFLDPILAKAKSFITDSVWELNGPNLSTKARTADARPWVERFWIGRYGAMNRGYRVIQTAKKAAALKNKVGDAYEKIKSPLVALVKHDLQKMAEMAAE